MHFFSFALGSALVASLVLTPLFLEEDSELRHGRWRAVATHPDGAVQVENDALQSRLLFGAEVDLFRIGGMDAVEDARERFNRRSTSMGVYSGGAYQSFVADGLHGRRQPR